MPIHLTHLDRAIVAAMLVAYLGYTTIASHGPTIIVSSKTAAGLREEHTQVFHRSVSLGMVERIELSEGAEGVLVRIRMDARAEPMSTKQTQFWAVRPRFAGGAMTLRRPSSSSCVLRSRATSIASGPPH